MVGSAIPTLQILPKMLFIILFLLLQHSPKRNYLLHFRKNDKILHLLWGVISIYEQIKFMSKCKKNIYELTPKIISYKRNSKSEVYKSHKGYTTLTKVLKFSRHSKLDLTGYLHYSRDIYQHINSFKLMENISIYSQENSWPFWQGQLHDFTVAG